MEKIHLTFIDNDHPCPCGSCNFKIVETPYEIHFGKVVCFDCDRFVRWYSKPGPGRSKRKIKRLKPQIDYCQICLRTKESLTENITLEEHHILPYEHYPEYDNEKGNRLVVCTHCHDLIELMQKMLNPALRKRPKFKTTFSKEQHN